MPSEYRIPHPVLGWVLEPGASYVNQMPEATVSVTYNSEGWRDLEHPIQKPKGVFRILVLGDSFMEAYSVGLNDSFHRRVDELVRGWGYETEVINMGVAGYGTLQEYLVFRDRGRRYEPDLVLLGFFDLNDLIDNSLELSSMLKPEGITTLARPFLDPNEPTRWTIIPGDFEAAQRHYEEEKASFSAQRRKLTERLILLRLARAEIRRLGNPKSLDNLESNPDPVDREREELALLGVNYCVEPPEYTRAWASTERILAKLKEDVETVGGKLVVFTVPALEEVNGHLDENAINISSIRISSASKRHLDIHASALCSRNSTSNKSPFSRTFDK